MTYENRPHPPHQIPRENESHGPAKKKAPTKCDNCGATVAECKCQTGCCGGACPNCNF